MLTVVKTLATGEQAVGKTNSSSARSNSSRGFEAAFVGATDPRLF